MGYEVHITRTAEWTEAESVPITLAEWQAYLASDSDMRADGFAEASTSAGTLRYEKRGIAVWRAWSKHGVDGNLAWFDLSGGRITVKNPDAAIVAQMCVIAQRMEARVQGDDGENHPGAVAPPSTALRSEAEPRTREPDDRHRSWWQRLLGR